MNGWQLGSVFYKHVLPTNTGLVFKFNTYQFDTDSSFQYNAGAAERIAFVMAAAEPGDPTYPPKSGAAGGALGYGNGGTTLGIPYGYLGVGLNVYGTYLSAKDNNLGCANLSKGHASTGDNITIKGPGDKSSGYCPLTTTGPLGSGALDNSSATTRPKVPVPVEVVINPLSTTISTTGLDGNSISVPSESYYVEAIPYSTSGQQGTPVHLNGALPLNDPYVPPSWIDPSTHLPYDLSFGWTASSGSGSEYHTITDVTAETLLPMALTVVKTEAPGSPNPVTAAGQKVTYDFLVTNTGEVNMRKVAVTDTQAITGETLTTGPTCPETTLAPGAYETCTATFTVTQADINARALKDSATVTGTSPSGATFTSTTSTLSIPVTQAPVALRIVTGPPSAPGHDTDALPIGLSLGSLGLASIAYLSFDRKRRLKVHHP